MRNLLMMVAAVIALAPPGGASPARAEDRSEAAVPVARRLFNDGVRAARQRRWQEALDRFSRSYQLAPRLLTLFNLAAAQRSTGHVVEAAESYRQFLRETEGGRYPEYRKDARRAIAGLERRIAYARIEVEGLGLGDEIVLDHQLFPQAGLGEPVPLDPGSHTLVIRRSGQVLATRRFELSDGGSATIELKVAASAPLDLGVVKGPGEFVDLDQPGPVDEEDDGSFLSSPWFWGAVVVVAGSAGGYLLLRDRSGEPTAGTLGRGVIEF